MMLTISDQPSNRTYAVIDYGLISGDGRGQPVIDTPTTPALRTLDEAVADLGIMVNEIRQRIKRGTLLGTKSDADWLIDAGHRPAMDRQSTPATNRPS